MSPRKGTPEYEAWKNSPEYEVFRQGIVQRRTGKPSGMKGKHPSQETKKKISLSQKGKARWTEEEKARMSIERKGRTLSAESIAKRTAKQKGMRRSEESKAKLRASQRTPQTYAKRSTSMKAHFASLSPEEQAAYVRKRFKSTKNKNTDIERYVASQLDKLGVTYEQQKQVGRYYVDFFIASDNLIVEVHGCFWHYCEVCGYNGDGCLERRKRDSERIVSLERKGYTVAVVWAHDLLPFMKVEGNENEPPSDQITQLELW